MAIWLLLQIASHAGGWVPRKRHPLSIQQTPYPEFAEKIKAGTLRPRPWTVLYLF